MKKIIGILSLVLVFSFTSNAQQNNKRTEKRADYSPEQTATLQIKKMDLQLDLNENQEKAVFKLIEAQAIERKNDREEFRLKREKGEKPTSDERFEHQNLRLDKQLEHKVAMKKILSKEQFTKWEENAKDRMKGNKKRMTRSKNNSKKGNSQGLNKGKQQNNKGK